MHDIKEVYSKTSAQAQILILGDIIGDKYFLGNVNRLSPEAPVPVFEPYEKDIRLGGAANVYHSILALGGRAQLCGVLGNDSAGGSIGEMLVQTGNPPELVIQDESRQTTVKTRLIANGHHIVRIDEESPLEISEETERRILEQIHDRADLYDLIVFSDYNKGFLTPTLVKKLISLFNEKGKVIIADPKYDYYKYRNVFLIKPNFKEFTHFVQNPQITQEPEELYRYAQPLLDNENWEYIYVTMGDKGGALLGRNGTVERIPSIGDKVVDITGAGDAVCAALALALASKMDIVKSLYFASYVAGLSVSKLGTSVVNKTELL